VLRATGRHGLHRTEVQVHFRQEAVRFVIARVLRRCELETDLRIARGMRVEPRRARPESLTRAGSNCCCCPSDFPIRISSSKSCCTTARLNSIRGIHSRWRVTHAIHAFGSGPALFLRLLVSQVPAARAHRSPDRNRGQSGVPVLLPPCNRCIGHYDDEQDAGSAHAAAPTRCEALFQVLSTTSTFVPPSCPLPVNRTLPAPGRVTATTSKYPGPGRARSGWHC
jgi:hypothetical protein